VRSENLEIDRRREAQQLIAEVAEPPQTLVDIEKSRLTPHRFASQSIPETETDRPK
jgi:hypothetical protein